MSVDKFGHYSNGGNSTSTNIRRNALLGANLMLTTDGNYDVEKRRIENINVTPIRANEVLKYL